MLSWKEILSSQKCHDSIILGILRTSLRSRDHMIAICNGLIFDGNLSYAIPLNLESLNWCAGHGKQEVLFDGFFEQVQIGYKEKNRKKR